MSWALHPQCQFCIIAHRVGSLAVLPGSQLKPSVPHCTACMYRRSVEYWETHATIVAGEKPNGE